MFYSAKSYRLTTYGKICIFGMQGLPIVIDGHSFNVVVISALLLKTCDKKQEIRRVL